MKTLKLRIKDKHIKELNRLSGSVNFVWNYVNALCFEHLKRTGKFFSAYDLSQYTKGSGEYLGLHSQTLQAINETHAKARKQFKKAKLNWRTNRPDAKRKTLGWIPFKKSAIKYLSTRQTGKKALKSTLVNYSISLMLSFAAVCFLILLVSGAIIAPGSRYPSISN